MSPHKPPSSQKIQFTSLPPEIRHQIWDLTLPSRRIIVLSYDVRRSHRYFKFLNNHSTPITLQICRDSRAAAFRQGFFFTLNDTGQSVYFIPETDILYLWGTVVRRLKIAKSIEIPGLDRAINVGFRSSQLFCLAKPVPHNECWRRAIKRLYIHMPLLKTFNHITLDRPEMRQRELAIEPLSENDIIRWGEWQNDTTFKLTFPSWILVKGWVEDALDGSDYQPKILGWKLPGVDRS